MASRQRQIQQLQEHVLIRSSLLSRQTDELQANLTSCVNEVQAEATQCVSSVGHNQDDVHRLKAMLEKLNRITGVVASLDSNFFDLMDTIRDDDDEQETGSEAVTSVLGPALTRQQSHQSSASDNDVTQGSCAKSEAAVSRDSKPGIEMPPVLSNMGRQPNTGDSAGRGQAGRGLAPSSVSLSMQTPGLALPLNPALSAMGLTVQLPSPFPTVSTVSVSSTAVPTAMNTVDITAATGKLVPSTAGLTSSSVNTAPVHATAANIKTEVGADPACLPEVNTVVVEERTEVVAVPEEPLDHDKLPLNVKRVIVTYVENPWSFYVIRSQKTIEQLNVNISQHVWHTWDVHSNVHVGSLCLAQFKDAVFYRAQVQNVYTDGSVSVLFVDYGNSFITKVSHLLVLPQQFRVLPALAIHCCLSEVRSCSKTGMWTQTAIDEFQQMVEGKEVLCHRLPASAHLTHLPVLVALSLPPTQDRGYETSISACLIQQQLARPITTEDLVLCLAGRGPNPPLARPTPSCPPVKSEPVSNTQPAQPASSGQSVESAPGLHTSKFSLVCRDTEPVLSSSRLQNILRRLPQVPKGMMCKRNQGATERPSEDNTPSGDNLKRSSVISSYCDNQDSQYSSHLKVNDNHFAREKKYNATEMEDICDGDTNDTSPHVSDDGEDTESYRDLLKGLTESGDCTSFKAMAATVISPTNFYMHRVCPETGHLLDSIMKQLSEKFVNVPKGSLRIRSRKLDTKPGTLCCAQFTDGDYYRGLILQTESTTACTSRQVQVFFMDYGDTAWVPRPQVFPLPSEFHHVDPQAIWCSLAFVRPLTPCEGDGGDGDERWQWGEGAIRQFQDLLGQDKIFHVAAAGHLPQQTGRADGVQTTPLEVILEDRAEGKICINHDLIVSSVANIHVPPSIATSEDEELYNSDEDGGWRDMEVDAQSLRNTYKVDIADAGVALTGVKCQGGPDAVCRFHSRPSGCHKRDKCPYLHTDPDKHHGMSGNLVGVSAFDEDQSGLLPAVGAVVTVEVSCVRSPSLFYVTLPWGAYTTQQVAALTQEVKDYINGETLGSLNAAMADFYAHKRLDTDYSLFAPGEAVAAFSDRSRSWLRAKVIDIEPDKEEVLVMYVDFGDMEWLKERSLRQLDLQFLPLPPQAVECCLVGVRPTPPHETWPDIAKLEFFKLVNEKTLIAHVKERLWSGRLSLELFDTNQTTQDVNVKMVLIQKGLAVSEDLVPSLTTSSPSHPHEADPQDNDVTYVPG